jgi:hypothetical protein
MTVKEKMGALGIDPRDIDKAMHEALDQLIEAKRLVRRLLINEHEGDVFNVADICDLWKWLGEE